MELALHEVLLAHSHIVTQVVEAELVVRSEGDVAGIGAAACVGVRFVLVYAVHRQAVEHVQRAHPLGVSLGEVVIDGNDVDSLSAECVQEYRKGCHEGLSFSGRHLGYISFALPFPLFLRRVLAAVGQYGASEYLAVVVDHIPGYLVSSRRPVVHPYGLVAFDSYEVIFRGELTVEVACGDSDLGILREAPGRRFHDGEGLRHYLVEHVFYLVVDDLYKFVGFPGELFLFLSRQIARHLVRNLGHSRLVGGDALPDKGLERGGTGAELVIREPVYALVCF